MEEGRLDIVKRSRRAKTLWKLKEEDLKEEPVINVSSVAEMLHNITPAKIMKHSSQVLV